MKILIACEFSGIVREAFKAKGHDVWSCDLLPSEQPGQHIQGDVLEILDNGWDMMIAHPSCQYLSNAGVGYFNVERYGNKAIERWRKRIDALEFFMAFVNAPIEKVCIENPVGFANSAYRKADQIIHPYYFGDPHKKRTCLWLKNLPKLQYKLEDDLFGKQTATNEPKPIFIDKSGKARYFTDAIVSFGNNANKQRSVTFRGIAQAMADQWG